MKSVNQKVLPQDTELKVGYAKSLETLIRVFLAADNCSKPCL